MSIAEISLSLGILILLAINARVMLKLRRLTQIETGMGARIAFLNVQAEELRRDLAMIGAKAKAAQQTMGASITRAETVERRLETRIAALQLAERPEMAGRPHELSRADQPEFVRFAHVDRSNPREARNHEAG
ncbi:hypothetical protein [Mangrovicoccus algicola]|uniref:Uncharacterized protein n=1 Tax=Mangrovicoccus algicola TaxID=2771008 RepID=A0A8J6YWH6_9RHOB|nr:hypothetical protein [Mangrovicoccus algicola]MBE3639032.1 hypothetical protein [Mangrovicoccus algicola]